MHAIKKAIPAALLLAFAGAAQAQVSVYGLIDMSYGKNEFVKDTKADLHSGGDDGNSQGNSTTRFGFKGSNDVGNGIKANFKFESGGLTTDGAVNGTLFNRQAWLGFSGGFGEVRFGRQDDVAFQTMADFDLNGASNGASAIGYAGIGPWLAGGRQTQSIQYISPTQNGLKVQVGFSPKGERVGAEDHFSAGVTFAKGAFAAAVAFETKRTETDESFASVTASYDLKVAKVVVGFTDAGGDKNTGTSIGVVAPIAGYNIGFQHARHNDSSETKNSVTEVFVNKEVLKNTYAYIEGARMNDRDGTQSAAVGVIYVF